MPKCVYCEKNYKFPRGITLIAKDGAINYLCSPKCRKNLSMGRRKVRWLPSHLKFNPKNKIKTKKRRKKK